VARLGKVLVSLSLITPDQLRQGIAAQILYGGRLGTNLVELGVLDLDTLATTLARVRAMPAALSGHFDLCDREIQEMVPARLAERWKAVPIGRLAHDASRIAIAAMDPLPPDGLVTLAGCLGLEPDRLVVALTPELRILYHLEKVYGVPRGMRFLRIRNEGEPAPVPEAPSEDTSDVEIEIIRDEPEPSGDQPAVAAEDSDDEATLPVTIERLEPARIDAAADDSGDADAAPGRSATGSDPALEPPPLDYGIAPPLDDEIGRGQRRFVTSLGDAAVPLARISVRHKHSEPFLRLDDLRERPRPTGPTELLRAVRRADSRDHVAELVVGGLTDLGCLDTVAILVVRPPVALGWRGFCPAGEAAIESLAVPLDQPSCLATIHAAAVGASGAIAAAHATVIDQRMWEVFGTPAPAEVLAAPIMLGNQVVCLLYGQTQRDLGPARELGPALAQAAGIAFGRLLRAAQR
jgi:hypothetical protein